MPIIEKEGKFYWNEDGPFESSANARKFGTLSFIRGHDGAVKLRNSEDFLKEVSEDEIRQAWQQLVADQGKKKITQGDAETLASVLTAELINRNQAGQPKEEDNDKLTHENAPVGKSDSSKGCLSCTDSHWSTVSGILNELVRLVRQGIALSSDEVTSRIQLVKEELNAWERYDASPDKLQNSDDFVKKVVREMAQKGAQLRHMLIEKSLGSGGGTIDALENVAAFARQASNEFQRQLNENGICLIDKPESAKYPSSVIAGEGEQVLNPKGAFAPASAAKEEEGEKPNPASPSGPVTGKTMESTGMNQMAKALVVAKASLGSGMFRYEIALGPISKEQATRLGEGKPGELLSGSDNEITSEQINNLIAGNILTSQLVLKAILTKNKVSKNEAEYVDSATSSDRCATCKFFIKKEGQSEKAKEPSDCVKVIGKVNPKGKCKLYQRGWGPARDKSTGQVRVGERNV